MRRRGMKRMAFLCVLAAAITGGAGAWAEGVGKPGHAGMDDWGMMEMMPPPPPVRHDHMAELLGLTKDQQTSIEAIFAADRATSTPLVQKVAEYRKQLWAAVQTATFDEAAIRAIAMQQAKTEAELILLRARMRTQVKAVLTTEQQALAEDFPRPLPGWHGLGPACCCGQRAGHTPPPHPLFSDNEQRRGPDPGRGRHEEEE
ncbi:MAG TPA: Spy/CpxP family protein refolding chaperone [Desulfuromonadaceae bacterium]